MAAPGGDFSFAPAAAAAPPWPTDEAAAAEAAAVAATAAAGPSQAEVEEELLSRFKDQLEAVMEESLGPLLASGGALDPEMARKIARETMLARFKDEIARLSASGALSPPPSAYEGSERGAGSVRGGGSASGSDEGGSDEDGSSEYTTDSDEEGTDSDEYEDESEEDDDDGGAAVAAAAEDYDEAAAYAAYAAAAAAAGYAADAPAAFSTLGRAPLAYRGPDAAAELAAAVAAAVEAGELDPYAAADAAVDATVMLRRTAPAVVAADPDAEANTAAADVSARLVGIANRAAEAEAVAAASRERARRAFERLGLPIAPSLRRPEEVEALRKASDAMLDEADAAGHGPRPATKPKRVYTLPSAAATIEGDDDVAGEPSSAPKEAQAPQEEDPEEAQLRQLRQSSTKATHAAVTSAAAAAAAAVAAARTRAGANAAAAAAAAGAPEPNLEATVRAKTRPAVPYMAVRVVKPGGIMLPPEEPERTRHVDRRSLLEEDVAPVAQPLKTRLQLEEEKEALGLAAPPAAQAAPGEPPAFVGPGGGAYRGDKSLSRMC